MAMRHLAGVVWDPREPLPQELRGVDTVVPEEPKQYDPYDYRKHQQAFNVSHLRQLPPFPEDIILREPERNILPPLSISLRAKIVQDTAQVTVTQLFWNNSDYVIPRCSYILPLPAGCTVTDFTCRIGRDRIVKAKVKPKEEARDAFNLAIRNNQTAGLLEQASPEVFAASLGNIPKRNKLRADISFVTSLKHGFANRSSTTTLTIPTCIASRYGTPPLEVQGIIPTGISRRLAIEVEVSCAERVQNISSGSHRITVQYRSGVLEVDSWEAFTAAEGENDVRTALATLEQGSTFLDRDFVLDIVTETQDGEELPKAWLEVHPSLQDHKALMLTIPPRFSLKTQPAHNDGEIVFVADRSGSMSDKMASLNSAIMFFLKGIPQGRKFNIWCFGTRHECLWPKSPENVSQQTLDTALQFVRTQFRADMGGTELLPALKAAISARDENRTTDIIVLTDGQLWQLDGTISYVQQIKTSTEGAVRVFALGIGNAVSHELVEGIAKAGGGYAEVIPSASQGGWEDRLVAMLEAAVVDHVCPLRIELDGEAEDVAKHERANDESYQPQRSHILKSPTELSLLSPFLRNRVYMLFNSDQLPLQHIKIFTHLENGQEKITKVPVKLTQNASALIHKLGVRAILGDLERRHNLIQSVPNPRNHHSIEELELLHSQGESMGCKWGLISKWTSFSAVEEAYEPDGHEPDSFMDSVDGLVQRAEDGMDLLQPRGRPAQRVNGSVQSLLQADEDMDIDLDEEDDTLSDTNDADLDYRKDDCSDSEDGDGGDPRGGGVALDRGDAQGGGGAQDGGQTNSEGAEEGQTPQPGCDNFGSYGTDEVNEARGSQNESSIGGAQHAQDYGAGDAGIPSVTSEDSLLSSGLSSHKISYGIAGVPNYRNPHLGHTTRNPYQSVYRGKKRSIPTFKSASVYKKPSLDHGSMSQAVTTKRAKNGSTYSSSPTNSTELSSYPSAKAINPSFSSMSNPSHRQHERAVLIKESDPQASEARRGGGSLELLRPEGFSAMSRGLRATPTNDLFCDPQPPSYFTPHGSNISEISENVPGSNAFETPNYSLPMHHAYDVINDGFDAAASSGSSLAYEGDMDSFLNTTPDITSMSYNASQKPSVSQDASEPEKPFAWRWQFAHPSTRSDMTSTSWPKDPSALSAPNNNLSANSALVSTQASAPKSEEEIRWTEIVRRLIQRQEHDGSFSFGLFDTNLRDILGDEFLVIVGAIADKVSKLFSAADTTAIPIAIVTLFELRLEFCQKLWSMSLSKTKTWIDVQFSRFDLAVSIRKEIYDFALERMQSYHLPKPPAMPPSQSQPQDPLEGVGRWYSQPVSTRPTVMASAYAEPQRPSMFSPPEPFIATSLTALAAVNVEPGPPGPDKMTRAEAPRPPLYIPPARPTYADCGRVTLDSPPGEDDV